MLRRFCLCLSLLIISFHANAGQAQKNGGSDMKIDELVPVELLEHCGLDTAWEKYLFVKPDEKISRMLIHDKYLFVFTDQNYLYCLNRQTGQIAFSLLMAKAGLPVYGPSFYKHNMYFLVGQKLHIVDLEVGRVTNTKNYSKIGKSSIFAPVRNETFFYVAGSNRRIYGISVEKGVSLFEAAPTDSSEINSIIADDDHLVFSTGSGQVVRIKTDEAKRIWRFEVGGIACPLVREEQWIYVSSLDRKIYKLNLEDGFNGWLTSVLIGEPLHDPVRIGKKTLYQYAGVKGLFAIDKESGDKLWQIEDGFDLLCENGTTAYTLAKPSKLVVMDNEKHQRMYSVNFADVAVHAVNTDDSMIYISGEKGRIMCIKTK